MKTTEGFKRSSTLFTFLLLALLAAMPIFAQNDPPGRVARLSYMQGTVSLQPSGVNDWSTATLNYPVTTGDRIYTDQGSKAELELGTAAIRVSETTDLTVANLNDQIIQLGLAQGAIRVHVYDLPNGNSIEVDTPNGALNLIRPGDYRVDTFPDNNVTLVSVNSGRLEVTGGNLSQTVNGGEAVELTGTDPIQASFASLPAPDDFDRWSADRDRRYTSSASARYVSRDIPGYRDLDDYGRWDNDPAYGPVWYPSNVPGDWAPYRYGHWVWVEPWGWTWVEDEPWGFAPFHYGRWAYVRSRWGWVPGPVIARPIYAPALVAFVGGSHFSVGISVGGGAGVAAWFPLGPQEPYYPWYHHDEDYLHRVNANNVRSSVNITNINKINNINNFQFRNRDVGTTAVPATALQNGQPVPSKIIRVSPEQIRQAQVIQHPSVNPTVQAVEGGRPTKAPPIRSTRVFTPSSNAPRQQEPGYPVGRPGQQPETTRTMPPGTSAPGQAQRTPPPQVINRAPQAAPNESGQPRQAPQSQPPVSREAPANTGGRPGGTPQAPPQVINRVPPAAPNEPGQPRQAPQSQPPVSREAPANTGGRPGGTTQAPRLITRNPTPPPRNVPFETQRQVMQAHPGRPLEPQQLNNLRAGRPAGPMRDREVLPHAAPPQDRGSRPSQPTGKQAAPSKKDDKRRH